MKKIIFVALLAVFGFGADAKSAYSKLNKQEIKDSKVEKCQINCVDTLSSSFQQKDLQKVMVEDCVDKKCN